MSKFIENLKLSNKDIIAKRASLIEEEAKDSLDAQKLEVNNRIRAIKKTINNLEDLHPDTTESLNPVKGDFDGIAWIKGLVNAKVDLKEQEELLEIISEVEKEFF